MALSALDLFSVGIGPSSSHTVGPMRAARSFALSLKETGVLEQTHRVHAQLFGSLGATGHGHGSDRAVLLGLEAEDPETVDIDRAVDRVARVRVTGRLSLAGIHDIRFDPDTDLVLHRRQTLPTHPNGMTFEAFNGSGESLALRTYYSVGGGFVVDESAAGAERVLEDSTAVRFPFTTGRELLDRCNESGLSIAEVMMANEQSWRPREEVRARLLHLWDVMQQCVESGCTREETVLPGGLKVRRRAPELRTRLREQEAAARGGGQPMLDPLWAMEWVNLYALAVNEENASGGRIVTAPTNGAAGIIPAVLHFYTRFTDHPDSESRDDRVVEFLLTAAAIGILFKLGASISGAEVGCQGEVGSACSMAAAGLCAVLGGTPEQVENAAEIGIEHNLGLTCDPVGGLVQIPCIERNAIASVKAINAARLSRHGSGEHKVTLDQAIKTMRQTGADMKVKYKETSREASPSTSSSAEHQPERPTMTSVDSSSKQQATTNAPAIGSAATGEAAYVLTLDCPERPGIVNAVSGYLVERGGDIRELKQFDDHRHGRCFLRVHFTVPALQGIDPAERSVGRLRELTAAFTLVAADFDMRFSLRPAEEPRRVLIMVSRFAHCLNDLLFRARVGDLPIEVVAVVSNHTDHESLVQWHGIPFHHVPVTPETKPLAEAELLRLVEAYDVELVVLARYMQILSDQLVERLTGRAINIHHSFLPSFKGARPYHQAYDRGVKTVGATAHYVSADLDEGPIISQQVREVDHADTPEDLARAGRDTECKALSNAVRWHCENRVILHGNRTVILH